VDVSASNPRASRSLHSRTKIARTAAAGAVLLLLLLGSGCAEELAVRDVPSSLAPRGPAAADIAFLWWVMFALGTVVFVIVAGLLLYIPIARRSREDDKTITDEEGGRRWIWWGGVVLPLLVLPVVFFFNMRSLSALSHPADAGDVTVEVVGHRWWWEVRYPDYGFTTANEIHIPVGQLIQLRLTSADVIHSFWVPQLHGKMDLNPGETNVLRLQADAAGEYRGICAEFCGAQHARMAFLVVAQPPEEFAAWAAHQQQPAPAPSDEAVFRGQQVFLGSACVYCHTVRGTTATGDLGPDLTHFASRRTIGAATLDNNRGNLAGWIIDPQHIKPGNLMPPTSLPADDLQAILEYLTSLE
jgi:cytochrome c oxidase subunit II